ncbi:hypothetical protein NEOLI_003306 [Neolecta irregularis DAH-3]|uniref:Uncharacterized protein n=1 Tax=Neolecta irregularis (strain DAH-3) TaxID=1198029 RepID=A0A1U7LQI3_NEOID|nr:hypothetical protein NEOLI_003306 [Neolecta irregularis DAH-3]|eukprot:OLL24843.1 hypothetical protein NEOLI_003306 [Neolecta irregularis DAH-3]
MSLQAAQIAMNGGPAAISKNSQMDRRNTTVRSAKLCLSPVPQLKPSPAKLFQHNSFNIAVSQAQTKTKSPFHLSFPSFSPTKRANTLSKDIQIQTSSRAHEYLSDGATSETPKKKHGFWCKLLTKLHFKKMPKISHLLFSPGQEPSRPHLETHWRRGIEEWNKWNTISPNSVMSYALLEALNHKNCQREEIDYPRKSWAEYIQSSPCQQGRGTLDSLPQIHTGESSIFSPAVKERRSEQGFANWNVNNTPTIKAGELCIASPSGVCSTYSRNQYLATTDANYQMARRPKFRYSHEDYQIAVPSAQTQEYSPYSLQEYLQEHEPHLPQLIQAQDDEDENPSIYLPTPLNEAPVSRSTEIYTRSITSDHEDIENCNESLDSWKNHGMQSR